MVVTRAGEVSNKAAVEGNVGKQPDQLVQEERNAPGDQADTGSEKRHEHHPKLCRLGKCCVPTRCACGCDCGRTISVVVLALRFCSGKPLAASLRHASVRPPRSSRSGFRC